MQLNKIAGGAPLGRTAARSGGSGVSTTFASMLEEPDAAPAAIRSTSLAAASLFAAAEQAVVADREARKHGRAVLRALAHIQLATLRGGDPEISTMMGSLASLAASTPPEAHDPILRLILREISLRAEVELARTQVCFG